MSTNRTEHVVVVDEHDLPVGVAGKLEAHRGAGILHRAVSACLFDEQGRVVLQRRAMRKYHFAGRWSNTCCTHPRPGERPETAIVRRLREELGVTPDGLRSAGSFTYRAVDLRSGYVEHELDHVFTGTVVDEPRPHPDEVMDWRVVDRDRVAVTDWGAGIYTPWLADVLRVAGIGLSQ